MAATKSINDTINFVRSYLNWANLTIGTSNEPAMSAANLALQTITGPPFVWPWNRASVNFLALQGVQDYNVQLDGFAFLETATIQLAAAITSVSQVGDVITFTAANNFASLDNGGVGAIVKTSGNSTPAYNGIFTILTVSPTGFTVSATQSSIPTVPLIVQSASLSTSSPTAALGVLMTGAITAGNFLFAFCRFDNRTQAPAGPSISDTAGNNWVTLLSGDGWGLFQCVAVASAAGTNTITINPAPLLPTPDNSNADIYIVEVQPPTTWGGFGITGVGGTVAVTFDSKTATFPTAATGAWEAIAVELNGTLGGQTWLAFGDSIAASNQGVPSNVTWGGTGWLDIFPAGRHTFSALGYLYNPAPSQSESGAIASAGPIMPLEIKWGAATEATEQDRPSFISIQTTNESGVSLTFRVLPIPDSTYQLILNYQEAPPIYTAPSDLWGIPDQYQYLYTYFFMFLMMDYFDDPRAGRYRQLAIASLLARQSGLDETDRNMFLGNWLPTMAQEAGSQLSTNQGSQARGL